MFFKGYASRYKENNNGKVLEFQILDNSSYDLNTRIFRGTILSVNAGIENNCEIKFNTNLEKSSLV